MAISSISAVSGVNRTIAESREALFDLQRQLASGKAVTTYGQLGQDRSNILSLRGELSKIEGYQDTIKQVNIRLDVLNQALGRLRDVASETRADSFIGGFELQGNGQTLYQLNSVARLDEAIALLNSEVGGRHLIGGREIENPPVLTVDEILNGSGGAAGFNQVAQERRQADLGADGRGRLALPAAAGPAVSLSEDVAGHPFGFKLNSVASTLSGTTVAGPAGAPATIDVTFSATLPQDGERLTIVFDLPDGTQSEVSLTATSGTPGLPNEFQIGVDENATAANFQAALDGLILTEAQRSLSAASAFAAADNFFDFDATTPPQRVGGPPFDTATTLVNGTTTDTVFWYQGELSTSLARQSAIAKADATQLVAYGARANETAFVTTLKNLAVVTSETFSASDPDASRRYDELRDRVNTNLGFPSGTQSIDNILTELTVAQSTLGRADERHQANSILLGGMVEETENIDVFEVSAQILALQGRIEASLQVNASLANLSLVNFL